MKLVLLIIAVLVAFMIFRGGSGGSSEVESAVTAPKPNAEPQSTGAAPSPGNDPNMHNSPTRRLGF